MHMWRQVVIQILLFAQLNFLHPNINIHILHTVLVTFTMLLIGEFSWQSGASSISDHFLYSYDSVLYVVEGCYG